VTAIHIDADTPSTLTDKKHRADAIGRAAALLFDTTGYAETSLRDISIAAGLSKGGIYHYFSSKHEILFFILDRYLDRLHGNVLDELNQFDNPKAKLRFFLDRHLRIFFESMPEGGEYLNQARNLTHQERRYIVEREKAYAMILTGILAEMVNTDNPSTKLDAITYFIFGLYNSIMHWFNPTGELSIEEVSDLCFQLLMDGWESLSASEAIR